MFIFIGFQTIFCRRVKNFTKVSLPAQNLISTFTFLLLYLKLLSFKKITI